MNHLCSALLLVLVLCVPPLTANATHFRFGHTTWTQLGGNTVEVKIQNAWRRNSYSCLNPATLLTVSCTGPGGLAGVGDVISEFIGGTFFAWGDGSIVTGPFGELLYLVTSIDPANNWLFGEALDPSSLPAIDTALQHTYSAPGDYLAFTDSCCRISAFLPPNRHINNPDGGYRLETLINVGTVNGSPVSALPPIVQCPINAPCSFLVPGADPDGDALSFRLSTSPEASSFTAFVQPGPQLAPNAASIGAATGLYTWDTTGAALGPAGSNTLYSTQVTIEDGLGKSAIDFLIQLVPFDPAPPVFPPPNPGQDPVCETTQVATVGQTKTFDVLASDPDAGDTVTLNVVSLPLGATMTPTLPIPGNPVSSTFSWIPDPSQVGVHVVSFQATSAGSGVGQTLCSTTIEVIEKIFVDVDIKPGSFPNSINLGNKGVIPVAILGTADFAVSDIDLTTVSFGPSGATETSRQLGHFEDVNLDGFIDLVLHFRTADTGIAFGDTEACVVGTTLDATPIEGCDFVRTTVPACGHGFELAGLLPFILWWRSRRLAKAG